MRTVGEMIEGAVGIKYVGPNGAIIDMVQELSTDGRFDEVAMLLSAWFEAEPQSRRRVTATLPAIIVERYLRKQSGLAHDKFHRWQMQSATSSEAIRVAACSEERLPFVVAQVLAQIQAFELH